MRDYAKNEKVISAFLTCTKLSEIQKNTGLSKGTIQKLNHNEGFQNALNKRRDAIIHEAVDRMRLCLNEDVKTLQKIITDKDTSPQIKVNAISVMMNQLRSWVETDELAGRIEQLEEIEREKNG